MLIVMGNEENGVGGPLLKRKPGRAPDWQSAFRFFEVTCAEASPDQRLEEAASLKSPTAIIRARVEQAPQKGQAAAVDRADGQFPVVDPHPTVASPG
ncbi:hypothetical protein HFD88_009470 [Aspergillus terreus]|nr:hypothetical protein HFD88_009470 [Aspergillus terreus]